MIFQINPNDIPRVQGKLNGIGDKKIMSDALFVGGQTIKRIIAEYPPVSRRKQPFKTDKQRRYFFWAIRKNLIVVPYFRGQNPRSENLKARWMVRKIANGVEVANNASHARLVNGWETQAAYHKVTGWKTDRQVMTDDRDRIINDVGAAYFVMVRAIWAKGA